MKKESLGKVAVGFLLLLSLIGNTVQFLHSQKKDDNDNFIPYPGFVEFFQSINNDLNLDGYKNLGNNDMPQIVYIDKESSFGKRNYLTLDNQQSNLQTQKRMEFISDTGEELVIIDLIYLDMPLYKDLLYWDDPLPNEENEYLQKIYTDNIIVYNNVLIKIAVAATDGKKDIVMSLSDVTRQVAGYISQKI